MNLSEIHHIAIIVSDYEAAKDFYVNKLGFSVIRVMEECHLLAGVIIHTNWLTFNSYLCQLIHCLLHALHTK